MRTMQKVAGAAAATALLFGGAGLAFAQSTSSYNPNAEVVPSTPLNSSVSTGASTTVAPATSSTGTTTSTPGVPNTGAGGMAGENLAILGASAAIALLGGAYLMRQRLAM